MKKEEYLRYRAKGEIMPVAFEYWNEFKKPNYVDLDYKTFMHTFGQFHEHITVHGQGDYYKKVWEHYDKKFWSC